MEKCVFLDSSMQNHAESSGNFIKKVVLEPIRAKLNQKSEHGHVQHVPKTPSEGETLLLVLWKCFVDNKDISAQEF